MVSLPSCPATRSSTRGSLCLSCRKLCGSEHADSRNVSMDSCGRARARACVCVCVWGWVGGGGVGSLRDAEFSWSGRASINPTITGKGSESTCQKNRTHIDLSVRAPRVFKRESRILLSKNESMTSFWAAELVSRVPPCEGEFTRWYQEIYTIVMLMAPVHNTLGIDMTTVQFS